MTPDIRTIMEYKDKQDGLKTDQLRAEGISLFTNAVCLVVYRLPRTTEFDAAVAKSRRNELTRTSEDQNDDVEKSQRGIETYAKLVQEFLEINGIQLEEWSKILLNDVSYNREAIIKSFKLVRNEVTEGGKRVTWARIIALFAFAGKMSENYFKKSLPTKQQSYEFQRLVESLSEEVTCPEIVKFVQVQGGWGEISKVLPPRRWDGNLFFSVLNTTACIFKGFCTVVTGTITGHFNSISPLQ